MRWAIFFVCSLVAIGTPALSNAAFSRKAADVDRAYRGGAPVSVRSPDGQSAATVRHLRDRLVVDVEGAVGKGRFDLAPGINGELLWAPDSQAFFLHASEGGAVGTYRVTVVGRFAGILKAINVQNVVVSAFGHPVRCLEHEGPNVVGVAWLGSSARLLAAAEILPHSICDSMGNFKVYEIDTGSLTVVRKYGQLEAKRAFWPDLGEELRNADDDCARRPRSCWIPQLHQGVGAGLVRQPSQR